MATVGTFKATDRMIDDVVEVLKSGRISYGPKCREFEHQVATMHGCAHGVLSNSGTSSLQVALQTLKEIHGWQDGDEVIVPALTFVATVNIVLHCGLKPVLVDIEPRHYGINPDLIEYAITERTRCIIPVHLFGRPCRIMGVCDIARNHDLKVIEDSCETMFVGKVGSWGDIGCFSFYVAHLLTCGIGGMSVTNNNKYATYMRSLVNHGIAWDNMPTGQEYDPTFLSRKFRFNKVGHSFRITEIEAAIGLSQLESVNGMMHRRAANVAYLYQGLQHLGALKLTSEPTEPHMMFPIVLSHFKWEMMQHLNNRGIETREMLPLTNQPCYQFCEADYPIAKMVNERGYYVGCHQDMTIEELDNIINAHKEFYSKRYDSHI